MRTAKIDRRRFLEAGALLGAAAATGCMPGDAPEEEAAAPAEAEPLYRISLAEWSYFRELFGPGLSALGDGSFRDDPSVLYQGELDHLDFPARARSHGIEAVEYVNNVLLRPRPRRGVSGRAQVALRRRGSDQPAHHVRRGGRHRRSGRDGARAVGGEPPQVGRGGGFPRLPRGAGQRCQRGFLRGAAETGPRTACASCASTPTATTSTSWWRTTATSPATASGSPARSRWWIILGPAPLPDFGNFRTSYEPEEWYDRYQGVAELMPYAPGGQREELRLRRERRRDGDRLRTDDAHRPRRGPTAAGSASSSRAGWRPTRGIVKTKELLERLRDDLSARVRLKSRPTGCAGALAGMRREPRSGEPESRYPGSRTPAMACDPVGGGPPPPRTLARG